MMQSTASREPLVAVLLSSYNGERYIAEQLDSILRQSLRPATVLVRDDGSSDGTAQILKSYSRRRDIAVRFGANRGPAASFFELMNHAPRADYYCFSDQDDVWHEEKISRAARLLAGSTGPAMCFTNVELVDSELRPLARTLQPVPPRPSFENALAQNVALGCTMTFNEPALRLLAGRPVLISEIFMHDWWVYQVLTGMGTVHYDDFPTVKYRQHGANVIGAPGGVRRWAGRIARHAAGGQTELRRQAAELLRLYRLELPPPRRALLEGFLAHLGAGWYERLRYALHTPVYRQRRIDDFILRVLIATGRI